MINLTVWAIRNKETGLFLPATKQGRGFSFDEPTSEDRPRIFYTLQSARQALASWARGYHKLECETSDWDGKKITIGYYIVKAPHRKKEDMEIVEFGLFELKSL